MAPDAYGRSTFTSSGIYNRQKADATQGSITDERVNKMGCVQPKKHPPSKGTRCGYTPRHG